MLEQPRRADALGPWATLWCAGLALACAGSAKSEASQRSAAAGAANSGGKAEGEAAGSANVTSGGNAGTMSSSGNAGGMAATSGAAASSGVGGAVNSGAAAGNSGAGGSGGTTAGSGSSDGGRPGAGGDAAGTAAAGAQASAGAAPGGAGGAEWSSTFPTFIRHTIASFNSGYMTVVADIDHDGMPDVVALSSGADGLVWFKNPTWTKYTITKSAKQLIYAAPHDVDGDGDIDLAIASDFDMTNTMSGGTVSWAEAPDDPTQNQDWTLHTIGSVPTSHRLRWADLDGDGKRELIDLPIFGVGSDPTTHAGAVALTAFTMPADPKGTWTSKVLDKTHLETAHGLAVVDWDGDQAEDLLTAANDGVDLFRPSLGSMAEHLGAGASGQAPTKGSSEVGLGSLGGARFIATIDPVWYESSH